MRLPSVRQGSAGAFPGLLSGNTTGLSASIFLGAPDDRYAGLGADGVNFDFGPNVVVNRPSAVDINVYEMDFNAAGFGLMTILVSPAALAGVTRRKPMRG